MNTSILEFPISIYGEAKPVNDILTKIRCRIFYKGPNRNGTYITDEFAEMLINSLHYVPIKGIFEDGDYTDHGNSRDEGRIYGIVPEANNFAWENHIDEDGVERTYACSDVYMYTALYPEARQIAGKSLSMELYEHSLKYHAAIFQGQKYIVFDKGCFLGLQVLGDEVEPCFEGASFFALQDTIDNAIRKIKEYSKLEERSEMQINFKLSDDQKYRYIWELLNPEYNEEGNWTVGYSICDIYDDYAIAFNIESCTYERIYYSKNDESDSIEIGDHVRVYIVDVTEQEKSILDSLQQLNGGNYELLNENLVNAEKNAAECAEFGIKNEELNNEVSTLKIETENAKAQYSALQAENEQLTEEVNNLRTYKKDIENQSKEAVIAEYANMLSEEVIESYQSKLEEYTVEELDMHLAYELKKVSSSMFTQARDGGKVPKEERFGIKKILDRYKVTEVI